MMRHSPGSLLRRVETSPRRFEAYRPYATDEQYDRIHQRARQLRGARIVEVNSTPSGGGVATLLVAVIPVLQGLGLDARWYSMGPLRRFFQVTRKLHDLLQGAPGALTTEETACYCQTNEQLATEIEALAPEVLLIHDPQPAAVPVYLRRRPPALIWRGHIDLSQPNPRALAFIEPILHRYDRLALEVADDRLLGIPLDRQRFIPDAIDPLTPKNQLITREAARRIMARVGVPRDVPVVTQVARFDPWKNPIGVVRAYRIARQSIPNLQLAMLGTFSAQDDPTAELVYQEVKRFVGDDPDVHLYTDPRQIGDLEVNAFQTGSEAILQLSRREGFGIAATEAMWKGNVVIGGDVPGLRAQITDGVTGFLVDPDDVDGCAGRIVQLVRDRRLARTIGQQAHEHVRAHFLLPRLIDDWLGLYLDAMTHSLGRAA